MKEILGESRGRNDEVNLKDNVCVRITCQKEVANIFNKFFVTVADGLRDKIASDQNNMRVANLQYKNGFNECNILNSMFLYPVTIDKMKASINSLSTRKSAGYDNISPQLMKSISDHIADKLAYLINLSFAKGEFPKDLKKGIVIPLHKKGDKENTDNYRPVTLLSIFSKVFEKAMKK